MIEKHTKDKIRDIINEVLKESNERNAKKLKDHSEEVKEVRLLTIDDDEENIQELGIDSLAYIRLIVMLEGYFDIEFDDDDIVPHKLMTVVDFNNAINKILKKDK